MLELTIIFTLGLASSLHCVQMCGPIVLSFSLPLGAGAPAGSRRRLVLAHLAYNAGRILTYGALGAAAGALGGALGFAGRLAGIENAAALLGGALMVVAGFLLLDLIPSAQLRRLDPFGVASRFLAPLARRVTSPTIASKLALGLMLGFLPCGLVYAALLKAAATGSPVTGALTMVAFGSGTVLALLAVGLASSAFGLKLGRGGARYAAVGVIVLGAFLIWRGLGAVWPVHSGPVECPYHQL
jgi:sulfite exporter TauE/SafE